jgi:hypothetical protein
MSENKDTQDNSVKLYSINESLIQQMNQTQESSLAVSSAIPLEEIINKVLLSPAADSVVQALFPEFIRLISRVLREKGEIELANQPLLQVYRKAVSQNKVEQVLIRLTNLFKTFNGLSGYDKDYFFEKLILEFSEKIISEKNGLQTFEKLFEFIFPQLLSNDGDLYTYFSEHIDFWIDELLGELKKPIAASPRRSIEIELNVAGLILEKLLAILLEKGQDEYKRNGIIDFWLKNMVKILEFIVEFKEIKNIQQDKLPGILNLEKSKLVIIPLLNYYFDNWFPLVNTVSRFSLYSEKIKITVDCIAALIKLAPQNNYSISNYILCFAGLNQSDENFNPVKDADSKKLLRFLIEFKIYMKTGLDSQAEKILVDFISVCAKCKISQHAYRMTGDNISSIKRITDIIKYIFFSNYYDEMADMKAYLPDLETYISSLVWKYKVQHDLLLISGSESENISGANNSGSAAAFPVFSRVVNDKALERILQEGREYEDKYTKNDTLLWLAEECKRNEFFSQFLIRCPLTIKKVFPEFSMPESKPTKEYFISRLIKAAIMRGCVEAAPLYVDAVDRKEVHSSHLFPFLHKDHENTPQSRTLEIIRKINKAQELAMPAVVNAWKHALFYIVSDSYLVTWKDKIFTTTDKTILDKYEGCLRAGLFLLSDEFKGTDDFFDSLITLASTSNSDAPQQLSTHLYEAWKKIKSEISAQDRQKVELKLAEIRTKIKETLGKHIPEAGSKASASATNS